MFFFSSPCCKVLVTSLWLLASSMQHSALLSICKITTPYISYLAPSFHYHFSKWSFGSYVTVSGLGRSWEDACFSLKYCQFACQWYPAHLWRRSILSQVLSQSRFCMGSCLLAVGNCGSCVLHDGDGWTRLGFICQLSNIWFWMTPASNGL